MLAPWHAALSCPPFRSLPLLEYQRKRLPNSGGGRALRSGVKVLLAALRSTVDSLRSAIRHWLNLDNLANIPRTRFGSRRSRGECCPRSGLPNRPESTVMRGYRFDSRPPRNSPQRLLEGCRGTPYGHAICARSDPLCLWGIAPESSNDPPTRLGEFGTKESGEKSQVPRQSNGSLRKFSILEQPCRHTVCTGIGFVIRFVCN